MDEHTKLSKPTLSDYIQVTDHVRNNQPLYENRPYPAVAADINNALAGKLSMELHASHIARLAREAGLTWLGSKSRRQGQEKAHKTRDTQQAIKDLQEQVAELRREQQALKERVTSLEQALHERYALQEAGSSNGRYEPSQQ